ncbi:MAG: GNAT family N-acetyltransferase [Rhodobacterales bacterium]|nr:GNAT family N-acetyltransferase [Rhodobacterales bacterium]
MITLRDAEAMDVPAIHAILQRLARHDGAVLRATEADLLRDGFGARPLFGAILAEGDRLTLGLVLFYPDYSTLRGRPGVLVQDLFVAEVARGQGLGRRLLAAALEAGRVWNASYLTLLMDRGNAEARRFYGGLGFRDRGDYDVLIAEEADLLAAQ